MLRNILASAALAVVLAATGAGAAWAGTDPGGSGGDDSDDHGHCPAATAEPAAPAGLGSLLSGAPGPFPPLPTSGPVEHPDRDPFYRPPTGFAACKPGTVLRSRVVRVVGLTSLTGSISAYQLLFRSTDVRGKAVAAATTLIQPTLPAPGPRKLVSYQVAEDSLSAGCQPSYTLRTNSGLPAETGLMATVLASGWALSVPDHQGPRSEFGVGPLGGQVTLDSIRAAQSFGPAGLPGAHTQVGMMGYSGGSVPTLWADALAHDYAPELNLVGAAAGGVFADIPAIIRANGGPPFFGGTLAYSIGLDRAYPDFDLESLLNERGNDLAARMGRDFNGCFGIVYAAPLASVQTHTRFPDTMSYLAVPRVAKAVESINLITAPRLGVPSLIAHGILDELAPVGQVDELVSVNCRRGSEVEYRRDPSDHVAGFAVYQTRTLDFLRKRFAGRPPVNTCG